MLIIERWMSLADWAASQSEDRSRKTGAVIVDYDSRVIGIGWNQFPRHINTKVESRHERPAKYQWTEHAERNAIYDAAALGVSTKGTVMFLTWYPCADCARAIIQAGIDTLFSVEPDWNDPKWGADFTTVRDMLEEAGVAVSFVKDRTAPVMK